MTWIERTAYPRLPSAVSLKELRESFTPSDDEMAWARTHTQSDRHLLALVVWLKCYQRLGSSPAAADTSPALLLNRRGGRLSVRGASNIIQSIASNAGLGDGITAHVGRHTFATALERRGVASDATFRVWRQDGAVRDGSPGTAGRRSRRQSEPVGQDGRDRTVLRQVPGCCVRSGCIRRKHGCGKRNEKSHRRGQIPPPAGRQLTHSRWLVNRSLPVSPAAPTLLSSPTCSATPASPPSAPTPAPPKTTAPRPLTCSPQTADQREQHSVC